MTITYTESMLKKAESYILSKLKENGFKETLFTHKNGTEVYIDPCSYVDINGPEDIEFYCMRSPSINLCGSESISYVANTLLSLPDIMEKDAESKEKLRKYWEKHIKDGRPDAMEENAWWDVLTFYSDWHKDCYGFRPKDTDNEPGRND